MKLLTNHKIYLLLFLGFPAIFLLVLLFWESALPYVGYNAWNFNTYALIAHNYNSLGFFETHFVPIISVAKTLPGQPEYYLNHPPLLSVLIGLVFRVFGESFFTGRLVNIVASFFSTLILFGIARQIRGKTYATIVLFVSSLLPATSIFGRMIGQESLLLLFALLSFYSVLLFEKSRDIKWVWLAAVSLILGALTDWASVYFSFALAYYLIQWREKRFALLFISVSIFASLAYILFIQFITQDISFLFAGFLNRSAGAVTQSSNWVLTWALAILTRFFLYFNPIFLILSVYSLVNRKKFASGDVVTIALCFLFFGLAHIILYTEGSFGHPYWTYYLLPFVVFASSAVIKRLLPKHKTIIALGLVFSLCYAVGLVYWKTKEVEGNVFRYELASVASSYFSAYQTIGVNRNGVIDPDIFQYSFHLPTQILEVNQDVFQIKDTAGFVFSCFSPCNDDDSQIKHLREQYGGLKLVGGGVEMWIFKENADGRLTGLKEIPVSLPKESNSLFAKAYRVLMTYVKVPQL